MLRPWHTFLTLDFDDTVAVYQQIADGIIAEIRKGRLKPGTPLPGTRVLAGDLQVNRKTVVLAYEALIAEGWLETADKIGTFVSAELPVIKTKTARTQSNFSFNKHDNLQPLSFAEKSTIITFNDGLPDLRLTPLDELAKAYKRIFQQKARWRMLGYGNEKGEERLRIALADMLAHKRGLNIDKEQICITRGSQMALYLTARTLIQPGDTVAIESPGYLPAWQTFKDAGAHMRTIPVDEKGLVVDELEHYCKQKPVKAVYVTPHHQFPTTVTMKMERRLKLIELANKYHFAIIEDDYDHEYHFDAKSLLPLASHEQAVNVIYISSMSKLVAPAVRVGYVTGSAPFMTSLAQLRSIIDRQGDTIMEHAIAELMEDGAIARHARRAHNVYRERREKMDALLHQYLEDELNWTKPEGGLAFWVKFRKPTNTEQLAQALIKKGVYIMSTEKFCFDEMPLNALRLGFASLSDAELEEGIKTIRAVLRKK